MSTKRAIVLLSGGLDSATTLAIARDEGFACHALSVQYGQRHGIELEAARQVAASLHAERHIIIPLDLRVFGGSVLTAEGEVPKDRDPLEEHLIPPTYVPARNTILLSLALAWAEVLASDDIFIGVNAVDYSGYPDCRPGFVEAFERLANQATARAVADGHSLRIHAPLLTKTKAEIIQWGLTLGVDYGITLSCYDPSDRGTVCGRCDACRLREMGFATAGLPDPAQAGGPHEAAR